MVRFNLVSTRARRFTMATALVRRILKSVRRTSASAIAYAMVRAQR